MWIYNVEKTVVFSFSALALVYSILFVYSVIYEKNTGKKPFSNEFITVLHLLTVSYGAILPFLLVILIILEKLTVN